MFDQIVIENIRLEEIEPHPGNRRTGGFNEEALQELADSIRETGVHEPAIVRLQDWKNGAQAYQLVCGERRWRASKIAGVPTLPCIVRELTDEQVVRIQVIENLQREDVHPLDEAEAYRRLQELGTEDVAELAAEIGKSKAYVYGRLKLLDLVPIAVEKFTSGDLTLSEALLISRLPIPAQKKAVSAKQTWWKLRDLEQFIKYQIFLKLSDAPFDLDDPGLVAGALPCTECPKRTGNDPALFEDISDDDHCLDGDCFKAKQLAQVDISIGRLQRAGHEDPLRLCDGHGGCPDGAVWMWNYYDSEEGEDGAVPGVIVSGHRAGAVVWVRPRSSGAANGSRTPEQQAQYRENQIRWKVRRDLPRQLALATVETQSRKVRESEELDRDQLAFVAEAFAYVLDYEVDELVRSRGIEGDFDEDTVSQLIAGMTKADLLAWIIECATIATAWDVDDDRIPVRLKKLLEANNIDIVAIQKEVEERATKEVDAELAPAEGETDEGA